MKIFNCFFGKISIVLPLIFFLFGSSCKKESRSLVLNQNDTLKFTGTFKFINSTTDLGTISLRTSTNFYDCSTSLPYGHGAGKILIDDSSIDFVDTLFFVIPAIYGPSFVLSGEYSYQFDGKSLKIKTNKESYNLIYNLKLD
ncbi:MAG: hypothetical protein LLG13_02190 [Bacteroidales bacterium]|nr:hypothetical protein [Bacteroidales bacterium]